MLSMRLTCTLVLSGILGVGVVSVACTQQSAASPGLGERGDGDDDDDSADDDDDTASTADSGSTTSSSSSGSTEPVDSGPPPKSALTFFVTSVPAGDGGNLGGLDGADKKCLELATAVQAGDHTWAAFLSVTGTNAKDRIGPGPWKNQKGEVVATDVASLFDSLHPLADSLFVDEKGGTVPEDGRFILTGTKEDGTPNGKQNCNGWASNDKGQSTSFGDTASSTNPVIGANWAFAKNNPVNNNTSNCTTQQLNQRKSQGRVFCFAKD